MSSTEPAPSDDTGYAEALAELEGILAHLEDDGIDIDLLGEKVARATTLIRLCRDRITAARVQVERVVAELDTLSDEHQP